MIRQLILLTIAATCVLSGCEEPPQVRTHRVAKSRSGLDHIRSRPFSQASSRETDGQPARMVVAIAERENATWFFKITGPISVVEQTRAEWTDLLKSVTFDEQGNPVWTLPAGWTRGPDRPLRYATLLSERLADGSVQMAISSLGGAQDILQNVNRWRRQLSLPPIGSEQLDLEVLTGTNLTLQLFDESGVLAGRPTAAAPATKTPLTFDVPDGWKQGPTNSMVFVRLIGGTEERPVQITVSRLSAEFNDWLPNARRWSEQVGMPTDEEFVLGLTSDVAIGGIDAKQIVLIPEADEPAAMIAAMLERGDFAWFFKMVGDRKAVIDHRETFDRFTQSFRFDP